MSLTTLIDQHGQLRVLDYATLARDIGSDRKTIWRWRKGEDRPAVETQELIAQWVADKRKILKSR